MFRFSSRHLARFGLLAAFVILIPILAFKYTREAERPADSLETLKKSFAEPGKDYASAPLWVWHTKVTKQIIDSMMLEFKQNEFGGVFVHPRPGIITGYLSKDWFDLFQYTVKRGKELGLNVWIYDENSYPTGFAGGFVPAEMPESYNQGQMLRMQQLTALPENSDNIFVALKQESGILVDITGRLAQEKGKTGKYYLFFKEYYGKQAAMVGPPGFSYVDLMVKGVTEKFIDVTFKGYEKVAGNEFGKIVPGVFSDEPSIPAQGSNNVRWTPDLFSAFRQRWGYDLQVNLPSLFEETGDWKKVRHNYMQTISQLFIDRWSKPMYEYTEKHNLIWTGHYWEHGWPNPNDVPDNMAMYAWHQQPAIDMLFNQFDETSPNAQFGNIRAVKELASVANQLNKKRTLSETYGGGGWELTFKDMKRLGDWEYVLGVNFLNQHLSMMTLTGARKYDYPQSFSYHSPWWPYYKTLNKYFARLSFALSHGEQQNNILVLEPTTSAWMYWSHAKSNARFYEIGNSFQSFVTALERSQAEYDLGSENIIKDQGYIKNNNFAIGGRAYTCVVIPPGMENIDLPTFSLLKEFAEKGGKVIQFEKIHALDGEEDVSAQNFLDNKTNVLQFSKPDQSILRQQFLAEDFQVTGNGTDSVGGKLYHHRRIFSDGQLLFLSNASMESASAGKITLNGRDALLMDPISGEILDYPDQDQQGRLSFRFNVPPAGSILLFVSDKKQSGLRKYAEPGSKVTVKTGATKVLRPAENTLMIDFCDVQYGDTVLTDKHVGMAAKAVFMHHGFNKNPWDHQVQYKDQIVARDTFSKGTGFKVTYRFSIDKQVDFRKFRAVIEQGNLWSSVTVNGQAVRPQPGKWWLDRSFGVLEIGKYLKEGENALTLSTDPMSVFAEIEPVYILGNFNLASALKGWKIVLPQPLKTGSWNQQGLPLYGNSISYVKEINLPAVTKQFELQLGKWQGTVAAIIVNGRQAGVIWCEPNTLNITRYLKKGKNNIEVKVAGSLKNLLGPHHRSPKPGLVSPWQWADINSYPPGNAYDTYSYGLMDDFKILQF